MAKLVEDAEIYAFLKVEIEDDPQGVVLSIRDSIEDLLATMTSRIFGPEEVIANEAYDGYGSSILYIKRPLKVLTAITFRYDAPFTENDYNVVLAEQATWRVGSRRITLRSLRFPCGMDNILISYTAQADQPELAKQAVREATAVVYRRRGSEDARSEQIGTFQHVLMRNLDESMTWKKAVDILHVPSLG